MHLDKGVVGKSKLLLFAFIGLLLQQSNIMGPGQLCKKIIDLPGEAHLISLYLLHE